MAKINQIIKCKDGNTKSVAVSRTKAIHLMCTECMGFQASEVKHCTSEQCPLFPFRKGTRMAYKSDDSNDETEDNETEDEEDE